MAFLTPKKWHFFDVIFDIISETILGDIFHPSKVTLSWHRLCHPDDVTSLDESPE